MKCGLFHKIFKFLPCLKSIYRKLVCKVAKKVLQNLTRNAHFASPYNRQKCVFKWVDILGTLWYQWKKLPICKVESFLGSILHLNLMFSFSLQAMSFRCSKNTGSPKDFSDSWSDTFPFGASSWRIFSRAASRLGAIVSSERSGKKRFWKKGFHSISNFAPKWNFDKNQATEDRWNLCAQSWHDTAQKFRF